MFRTSQLNQMAVELEREANHVLVSSALDGVISSIEYVDLVQQSTSPIYIDELYIQCITICVSYCAEVRSLSTNLQQITTEGHKTAEEMFSKEKSLGNKIILFNVFFNFIFPFI